MKKSSQELHICKIPVDRIFGTLGTWSYWLFHLTDSNGLRTDNSEIKILKMERKMERLLVAYVHPVHLKSVSNFMLLV